MATFVLVHGAWHGSWCWSLVIEQLAARDIPSVAVDLEGYGLRSQSPSSRWSRPFDAAAFATEKTPLTHVDVSSSASALVEQIRRISRGEPSIVVAHSMGGTIATAAAELAPELFAELVYVTAFTPVSGLPAGAYAMMPECADNQVNPLLVGDPNAIGALRFDTTAQRDGLRSCFYNDVDEATADAAIALLSPDQLLGVATEAFPVTAERYGRIPITYVLCTDDNALPPPAQRKFIREIDAISATPTTVIEMASSHSPFLSRPGHLADVIAARLHPTPTP